MRGSTFSIQAITVFLLSLFTIAVSAQSSGDYRTRNDGNWNSNSVWQKYNGSTWEDCTSGDYPGVAGGNPAVTMANGNDVTLTSTPPNSIGSLSFNGGNTDTYLTFNGSNALNVTGNTTILSNNNGDERGIRVDGGTFTTGSLTINSTGGTDNTDSYIRINGGNVNVTGDITFNNTSGRTYILFSGSGNLSVGGNMSGGGITSNQAGATVTSGTVIYNSTDAQNTGDYTYYNLTLSGGGSKTAVGNITVSNILTLNSGSLSLGSFNLTLTNNAANAVQGTPGNNCMIATNGSGYFVRNAAASVPALFPVGSGGYYSPFTVNSISSTTGTISSRAVSSTPGPGYIDKYWDVLSSTTGKTITAVFEYDAAEASVTPTRIMVKPSAGSWQDPAGTQSFGSNNFTISGTTDITTTATSWSGFDTGSIDIYYSYQSGAWNSVSTWTFDPSGTTQTATSVPGNNDAVVILNGRTVTLTSNVDSTGLNVNINNGGILDLSTRNFTTALAELNGEGILRIASSYFPNVTTNTFVNAGGGTTEFYTGADFDLPSQATYNNLLINTPGHIATQMSNITLNGDLYVKNGTFRINNDAASAKRQLTIYGDVTVDANGKIKVGQGTTNTTTNPLNISGGTAPFLNYYDQQSHRVIIYGDFTNNGVVKFTNQSYPVYNSFPSNGFATVYFMGATDNQLTCNDTTDFYNLVLDKGIDQSYSLTVYSSAYSYFRLFGANISGGEGGGTDPNLMKALWIRTGTLVLKGMTIIPSLTEGTGAGLSNPNSNFYIPANGALILDGPDVVVLSTADDYREVNVAYGVSGGSGLVNGVGTGGVSSFSIYGKLQINDGYFSTRESGGFITSDVASGQFIISDGVIDAKQYRADGGSSGLASYEQSGGIFILRGRFQRTPVAYSSVSNLTDVSAATLNTTRATTAVLDGTKGSFNLNNASNVFAMTGGTIRIYDVCGDGSVTLQQKAFEVLSSAGNINVSGGTLELKPTNGTGTNSPNYLIISQAPVGNMTIDLVTGTSVVALNTYPLNVLDDLIISSGSLNANNLNVSVGGDFSIGNGTVYTTGTNWTIFNGSHSQTLTINTASSQTFKKFSVDKPEGTTLSVTGSQNAFSVADSMMIINGNLADGGKTITFTTSATTTTSYLYNSGVHSGSGKIVLADDDPQVIAGDGTGVFGNIQLNNNDALAAPVSLSADLTINGTLTFSLDKLLNINIYNLKFGTEGTVSGYSSARFIETSGNAGDKGVTKIYSATSPSFTFHVGSSSTSHATVLYAPATISLNGTPSSYGSITVNPVGYEHPATTTNGRSLTYFWRVRTSGTVLGASASATHTYIYQDGDVVAAGNVSEDGYIAARYNQSTFTWSTGTIDDVDQNSNTIGEPATSGNFLEGVNFVDGDYTAGDNTPTNPFNPPVKYYSRQTGLWSNNSSWSLTGHSGAAAGSVPGLNDIVIIGGNDSIYLTTHTTNPNTGFVTCASLQIERGSALDIGFNPSCNFGMVVNHPNGNGNFRLTTSYTSGFTYEFPGGDFTDFNQNLGTTELYTTNPNSGTTYWLPNNVSSYGNLIISPLGGSNIIFGNTNLTIYGNLVMRGQDSRSWFCPTWNSNYPTAPTARAAKNITIRGNFQIQGGALIYYGSNNLAQNITVDGDVIINEYAGLRVYSTATNQKIEIGGSLINNATTGTGVNAYAGCDFTLIPVTFFGDGNETISNTSGTPTTVFSTVYVNKGNSQSVTLTIDIGGTLTTPADNWLFLQNGTLRYMRNNPSTDFTISAGSSFSIPSTAGLFIDYSNSNNIEVLMANNNTNTNDLYLDGKLTVVGGSVYVGPTNGTTANNNDIIYSGGGASAIEIQGGSLIVNGQIRRTNSTADGILNYTQSGGNLIINGQAANTTNAKLEILNAGSSFNMTDGAITIVRGGGGNTYGDLYLRPGSGSVTGGQVIFTQSPVTGPVVDSDQNYILDANINLNDLIITGETNGTPHNALVKLLISPLTLNGDLTISNGYGIFDANTNFDIQVTIKGDFTNNGTYNHYENLTTFSGDIQTLQGTSTTDFYNMVVSPVTSLTLIRDINVNRDLTLSSGQLLGSTFNINVKGNLVNNATYSSDDLTGGVILNGSQLQLISGTGTFSRLELNNPEGARTLNNITLQKNLKLTAGVLDINNTLLSMGVNSNIEGSSFGPAKMITTDGVFSNVGVRKFFSIYNGSLKTFTYPLGTSGMYTPAVLSYTTISNVGYVRLNNINSHHPGVFDENNVLQYFWELESSGVQGFNGTLVLNYHDDDVAVTAPNTEADYIAARLIIPGTSWIKAAPGPGTDNVDESANTITFSYSNTNNLSGEYTAGIDVAIPDEVPEYISITDGVWSDETNWQQIGGDSYPCPEGGPNGFIVTVAHEIDVDADFCSAYRTNITGRLNIISPYAGHNFGTVTGNGTIYMEKGILPAGRYAGFLDCSGNATLEYGGNTDYTILADLYTSVPNLFFTGSGIRYMPSVDLTICKRLVIDGPVVDNSVNNRSITLLGTIERYNSGSFLSGSGSGATVIFAGSSLQTLGGSLGDFNGTNKFNNLEIDNASGLDINLNGQIEIAGNLLLTNGNIRTSLTNTLTITNTAEDCVVPAGGSSSSFVDGPLMKKINQGDSFVFPVGKGTIAGNKITLSSTQTGTVIWKVEYFTPNATFNSYTSPLSYVNSQEYWTVSATSGSKAIIHLRWDEFSDLTPLMTENGITDMRVAVYNTGSSSWTEVTSGASGDNNNGTVYSLSRVTIPASGNANYTIACINTIRPRATLNPSGAVCGNAGIPVSFTSSIPINLNYVISYKRNGIDQTPITVSSLPFVLPTTPTGATYQLTGFTYNNPPHGGPIATGVVNPAIITTYTVPTTADAGDNQSVCGGTGVTLDGNVPVTGTGLWGIVTGTGGTVVTPGSPSSVFNGTNGTTYTLRWTISNGLCTSSDDVTIDFPLLPVKPEEFISFDETVCQGEDDVIYSVNNDPAVTYNWNYDGNGADISDFGNHISIDFADNASAGTLSVSTTNGCGTSSDLTLAISVNLLPAQPGLFTLFDNPVCAGSSGMEYSVTNDPTVTYDWTYSGSNVTINGTGNYVTLDFSVTATNGILSVTATNGCGTSAARTGNINVNAAPVPVISGNDTLCNDAVEIYTTDAGMSNYSWSVTGGSVSSGGTPADNSVTITWGPAGEGHVYLNYDNLSGCGAVTDSELEITIFKKPDTGPLYHIPDLYYQ